jgi:hypothetical protein
MKSQSPEMMRGQAYQAHGGLCSQVREAQDFKSPTPRHAVRQDSIPVWGLQKARSTHCTQSRRPEMQTIEIKPLASRVGKTRWRKAAQPAVTTGSPVVASQDAKHSQAEHCCCNPQQHPPRIKHALTGTLPTPTPHTVLPASAFHPAWSSAAAGVRTSCRRLVHPHCAPVRACVRQRIGRRPLTMWQELHLTQGIHCIPSEVNSTVRSQQGVVFYAPESESKPPTL